MYKKVCIYAICKNESKFIHRWFDSIKDADYICVLDTGSTDNTTTLLEEIRSKYPDKVFWSQKEIKPWRFDIARNESMKLIPEDTDICVSADLDDVFPKNWKDFIVEDVEKGYTKILGVYQYYENDTPTGVIPLDRTSIYGQAYWEGALHERLVCENENKIVDERFLVEHRQDLSKERRETYLEAAKVGAETGGLYGKLCYGYELYNSNRVKDSIKTFSDLYDEIPKDSEYLTRKWIKILADNYNSLGDKKNYLEWLERCLSIHHETSPFEDSYLYDGYVEGELAKAYLDMHDYCKAMQYGGLYYKLSGDKTLYNTAYNAFWKDYEYYNNYNLEPIYINYIRANYDENSSILDVGAENGALVDSLNWYKKIDAIEINYDKIELLKNKYNNVYEINLLDFRTDKHYDLVVLADILEHLTIEDAQKALEYFSSISDEVICVLPYMYLQDDTSNPYDVHIQYDLTVANIKERYPQLELVYNNDLKGIYTNRKRNLKVCAYAICKDEIKNVDNWLYSLRKADYICVLDTGSTDGTWRKLLELTEDYPNLYVKRKEYKKFFFDEARNDSLELVRDTVDLKDNNVLLCLDLDEYASDNIVDELKKQWTSKTTIANVYCQNVNMWTIKAYLLTDDLRWRYKIHEEIVHREGDKLSLKNTYYNHYQDTENKVRDYYGKLIEAHKEDPTCIHYLTYLIWEASLHEDLKALKEYCEEDLEQILNNEEDQHYHDWKHYIYVCSMYMNYGWADENHLKSWLDELDKQEENFRAYYTFKANLCNGLNDATNEVKNLKRALFTPITDSWVEANFSQNNNELYTRLVLKNYYDIKNYELAYLYAKQAYNESNDSLNESNLKVCEEKFKEILNGK